MSCRKNIRTSVPDGLAVADSFNAMTIDRPNQKVMKTRKALNELREHEGLHLDSRSLRNSSYFAPKYEDHAA